MFKKFLAAAVATAMVCALAACASAPESETSTTLPPTSTPASTAPEQQIQFEETVLVDNEACIFKITAIENDPIWGYTLKAYMENKTDTDLMFSLDYVSVDGYMCDPFFANTVAAGMKDNENISFSSDSFQINGISDVSQIEFTLSVYDAKNWSAEKLVNEAFTLYPQGEVEIETPQRNPLDSDIILFENEDCAMIVTGFDPDNIWGYTVNVYLVNKTDKHLMFSVGDAAVNGFMCDPFWAETVAAGKCSNTTISWSETDFEENHITDVESITLPIRVYEAENWVGEDIVNETFTLNP